MTETAADDQDLAKALDNVAGAAADLSASAASASASGGLSFEETAPTAPVTPLSAPSPAADPSPLTAPVPPLSSEPAAEPAVTSFFPTPSPSPLPTPSITSPTNSGPLADIKKDALLELRPLVDKLNVSAEEKFDTYLLLIRSTDDSNLIGPAHEAAKAITDETRRAEALLDIVKEIDYLSQQKAA